MSEPDRKRGCVRYGCFGCLGLLVVSGGLIAVIIAIQVSAARNPQNLEDVNLERELPFDGSLSEVPESAGVVDPASSEDRLDDSLDRDSVLSDGAPQPIELDVARERGLAPDVPVGRLELDLQVGDFELQAGEPGTPIRIDGEWDPEHFTLTEELVEESDGSFAYKIKFTGRRGWLGALFSGNSENRLTIRVPRGRPFDIVGEVTQGRSDLQLGGLWLRDVYLEVGTGEHTIEFADPTLFPTQSFHLEGSMGELKVYDLGNASPAEASLEFSMGALMVELDGLWEHDANISVDCSMGECLVEVPDDVHIDVGGSTAMGERSVRLPDEEGIPEGAPTLHLDVDGSMGEVRIR